MCYQPFASVVVADVAISKFCNRARFEDAWRTLGLLGSARQRNKTPLSNLPCRCRLQRHDTQPLGRFCRWGGKSHAQYAIAASASIVGGDVHTRTARLGGIDPVRPARPVQAGRPIRDLPTFTGFRRTRSEAWWTSAVQNQCATAAVGIRN